MRYPIDQLTTIKRIEPPAVETFVCEHTLDRFELEKLRRDPSYIDHLKCVFARGLAMHMIDKCQLFKPPSYADMRDGVPIRMEVVINDRGAHEHMLPQARDEGRREGLKQGAARVNATIPYGVEPGLYYE